MDKEKEVKHKIGQLILKTTHRNYYYCRKHKDGDLTAKQVYELFKNDPFWHVKFVKYDYVHFEEREAVIATKRIYKEALLTLIKFIVENPFMLGSDKKVFIFGGVARSAMLAWTTFKRAIYTFILCTKRMHFTFPKDVLKYLTSELFQTWLVDYLFIKDINDIDIKIVYLKTPPTETQFQKDVEQINFYFNGALEKTEYRYTPRRQRAMVANKEFNLTCHPKHESSYRAGDLFCYVTTFNRDWYFATKTSLYCNPITIDCSFFHDDEDCDFDVNNLILEWDFPKKRIYFLMRKNIDTVTLKSIEENIWKKQFLVVSPTRNQKLDDRIYNLERRGWKVKQ